MVPVPVLHTRYHAPSIFTAAARLLYISLSLVSKYVLRFLYDDENIYGYHGANISDAFNRLHGFANESGGIIHRHSRRNELSEGPRWKQILFPMLIPILVLLSGMFAGLTLGYMSLDETQLNVLSISGTLKQREYANKIKPIRKNGHLLLVTLLLANMIVNETLPVIADPVLGGGFQSVVVSTVLIVIFAEIIPQSVCTRHGLLLGAKMAGVTKCLIYGLGIVSWPVAKILELVLGKHHGIIYRRAELKELIAMHDSLEAHGGDLKTDTVTIIGATLDLQEKVVRQAMTPIDDVFMLSIDSKLDYDLMSKICQTGHSRVPVYEEVEVPIAAIPLGSGLSMSAVVGGDVSNRADPSDQRMVKVKKIIGVFLVKQCVLLDPEDATPLRKIPLNKVPFVPNNEPLLGMLDKFQEGRSHMAIVSRFSVNKVQSVKKAVKRGLTQRLRESVGMGDTDTSSSSDDDDGISGHTKRWVTRKKQNRRRRVTNGLTKENDAEDGATIMEDDHTLKENRSPEALSPALPSFGTGIDGIAAESIEMQMPKQDIGNQFVEDGDCARDRKKMSFQFSTLSKQAAGAVMSGGLEQNMPADAVLAKEGANEFLQSFDLAVMPLGIITLEDVLEELIGEEIYDEFDPQGAQGDPYKYDKSGPSSFVLTNAHPPDSNIHGPRSHHPAIFPKTRPSSIASTGNLNGMMTHAGTPGRRTPHLIPQRMKGFGFLMERSRSAPPVNRDQDFKQGRKDPRGDVVHEADDSEDEKFDNKEKVITDATTVRNVHRGSDLVITLKAPDETQLTPALDHRLSVAQEIRMPRPIRGIPTNVVQRLGTMNLNANHISTGTNGSGGSNFGTRSLNNSRSTSPTPSLEAILLERNRRRLERTSRSPPVGSMGSPADGTTAIHLNPELGIKGRRFKSSPLGASSADSSTREGLGEGDGGNVA